MPIAACFTSQVSLEVDPPLEEETLESAESADVDTGRTWHGGVLVNYPSPVHFLRRVEGYHPFASHQCPFDVTYIHSACPDISSVRIIGQCCCCQQSLHARRIGGVN
jgi:hypothetical protein